jgi:hypothetical protein
MAQAGPAEIGASNDSSSMLDAPLEVGNRRDPRNPFDAKWTSDPQTVLPAEFRYWDGGHRWRKSTENRPRCRFAHLCMISAADQRRRQIGQIGRVATALARAGDQKIPSAADLAWWPSLKGQEMLSAVS